jgi:hypothetical protein
MKRWIAYGLLGWSLAVAMNGAKAQPAEDARYQRLSASVDRLFTAYEAQQKRIGELLAEVRRLRELQTQPQKNYVTREELKPFERAVETKLRELNEKRESDKRLFLDQLAKLASGPPSAATNSKSASAKKMPAKKPASSSKKAPAKKP